MRSDSFRRPALCSLPSFEKQNSGSIHESWLFPHRKIRKQHCSEDIEFLILPLIFQNQAENYLHRYRMYNLIEVPPRPPF